MPLRDAPGAPGPEAAARETLTPEQGRALAGVARSAVERGVAERRPWLPDPEAYAPALRRPGASFVTLQVAGVLRGCLGSLEAQRALVVDVASHAFSAAFHDPRFPPLEASELPALGVHVSVLAPPEPLEVACEEELLARLRPGVDGLILEDGGRRGTFLPQVWESLPEPRAFLRELRRKAGLPPEHWSETLRIRRYTAQSIAEPRDE